MMVPREVGDAVAITIFLLPLISGAVCGLLGFGLGYWLAS